MEIALLTDITTLQNETCRMAIANAVKTFEVTGAWKEEAISEENFVEACACLS